MKLFKKPKPVKERLGPHTRKILAKRKKTVWKKNSDNYARFTKENKDCILWLETNYDLLQYNIIVRPYVTKIHKLDNIHLLDVLLYIFPVQFFTRKDFNALPIPYYHKNNFAQLLEKGYIEIQINAGRNPIYTTSNKTKTIVKDYYLCLSGRKKIKQDTSFKTTESRKQERLLQKLKAEAKSNPERFKNFIINRFKT